MQGWSTGSDICLLVLWLEKLSGCIGLGPRQTNICLEEGAADWPEVGTGNLLECWKCSESWLK